MASPPPNRPKTLLNTLTQAIDAVRNRVDFSQLALKPNARVPQLLVQESTDSQASAYPLLGDRYLVGRSSKQCDIVVQAPIVSQVHSSLARDSKKPGSNFTIRDEKSTNGIYIGKRRIKTLELRHGDTLTLGPPDLADAVLLKYQNPPPAYVKGIRYGLYGFTGLTALVALWILMEWQRFAVRPLPLSVQGPVIIYARDNQTPLRQATTQAHRENERLSEYPRYLRDAVIASEDTRYNWHLGVDPLGIARAVVANVRGGGIREGGSTLTQQLARNIFREYVGTEDSATRKLREAIVALKMETFYSKDALLLTYLNRVYLGNGNYGFEDAARFYFGKPAEALTLSEAATLVGILPAPNSFNPIQDYESAIAYRNRVLNRMVVLGMVSPAEAQEARRSRLTINPDAIEELRGTLAPYFYSQVFNELETLLGRELAQEGNFIVESTLDPGLQQVAETSLEASLATSGASLGISQGAIATLDASTGGVLALVGGRSFEQSQFNRATQALRQPGSTFKVFAYLAALEQGIPLGATYSCAPLNWQGQFYEGCRTGAAALNIYDAVALSENAVALRVAQEVGLDSVTQMARRFGIKSDLNPVPGLVLGQSEVTLLELTGAFSTLANRGVYQQPHLIQRVFDGTNCDAQNRETCRIIYDYSSDGSTTRTAASEGIAGQMTALLQGVVQYGTGQSAYIGVGEAGKTGTTNDNVDSWFVGYIPGEAVTTGVWLGNDENTATAGSSAVAAQLWGDYMGQLR
ncbi:MAG: transglycosylase domain-containing protein [Cyanobacteria bacterium P01_A01_bin.135]